MTAPQLRSRGQQEKAPEDVCLFGQTNFRNQMRRFGIKVDDRRRHMYVIGKTGMGKTTMMENMVLHDIYSGHGVGIVDPHGDFAEKIIDYIPPSRINDVVYFNPADTSNPIGFNILEVKNEEQKHLVAAGLMGTFKKIWPDVWSSRMEYILNNTLLALLDYPGSTLLGINRLLADKKYRKKVVSKLQDPVVKAFWQNEFANYEPRYAKEAVAPIQNKIGQFLSASVIRNMVAQVKSTIDVRGIMDSKKIFVMNLSKGRIGEDNSRLLGGMLITKIQLAAMERVDTPEASRKDFFLYVDEFQNFATPSFANILSEARKYRLSLIMAHQYIKQLDEVVGDAVFGNVGTIVTFRVGGPDAEELVKEFTPTFLEEDIVNLPKFNIFLKLMIDGVASQPFSAMTMPPIGSPTGSSDKVVKVSRERYAKERSAIEEKITRWSGMEGVDSDEEEKDLDKKPVGSSTKVNVNKSKANNKNNSFRNEKRSDNRNKTSSDKKDSRSDRLREAKSVETKKDQSPAELQKTISLADLKPKEENKQVEKSGSKEEVASDKDNKKSTDNKEISSSKPAVTPPVEKPEAQKQNDTEKESRSKKRRRRRKKKKQEENTTNSQGNSNSQINTEKADKPAESSPKPLSVDQSVKFE